MRKSPNRSSNPNARRNNDNAATTCHCIHQISRGRQRFPWVLLAPHVHDDVVGNGEEPGAEAVILTRRKRRQRFGEDHTRGVLGRVTVSQAPIAVAVDRLNIAPIERGEGRAVPLGDGHQVCVAEVGRKRGSTGRGARDLEPVRHGPPPPDAAWDCGSLAGTRTLR
jgi:hypothetical protein